MIPETARTVSATPSAAVLYLLSVAAAILACLLLLQCLLAAAATAVACLVVGACLPKRPSVEYSTTGNVSKVGTYVVYFAVERTTSQSLRNRAPALTCDD